MSFHCSTFLVETSGFIVLFCTFYVASWLNIPECTVMGLFMNIGLLLHGVSAGTFVIDYSEEAYIIV